MKDLPAKRPGFARTAGQLSLNLMAGTTLMGHVMPPSRNGSPLPPLDIQLMPLPDDAPALFDADDVTQALRVYDTACAPHGDRHAAMREVMMFALKLAAINLDVR